VLQVSTEQRFADTTSFPETLGSRFEEFVDELTLTPDAMPAPPPVWPFRFMCIARLSLHGTPPGTTQTRVTIGKLPYVSNEKC
jgi:hypothetical protein